jgi:hypothetical protein
MSRKKQISQSKRSRSAQRRVERKSKKSARRKKQTNGQSVKTAIDWFFGTGDIFSHLGFHGNIKWLASDLARMALLFSWSEKECVTDAFAESAKRCMKLGFAVTLTTYQGFILAITSYIHIFIPLMISQLHRRMQEVGGDFWEFAGFVPIAFDGSRSSAARTQSNEAELCCPTYGQSNHAKAKKKKKNSNNDDKLRDPKPQAWITLMWHMGLRLPWDWRLGPSNSSERKHVQEMVTEGHFPVNTLFCGDAGFVGYDFWSSILQRGSHFLVRVGSNVNLISENLKWERKGDGEVLCWPKDKQHKQPPLTLRLVRVKIGKTKVYLLTSVLDPTKLAKEAMAELYEMRWGIEIEFRGLKQTLNGSKLRCRNADRLYAELHWSILSMAIAELLALKEQIPNATPNQKQEQNSEQYSPKKRSLANTMRAIYNCLDELLETPEPHQDLFSLLAQAVTDDYHRRSSKKARFRPKNSKQKILGTPKVRKIEPHEREKIKTTAQENAA